ncbi:MAG: type secretion/conjugal transfer ATPase, VirB4 family [Rhodoferax sp.]|nr:type secretion/conjugal transfer ATPase, VirB4 family [Rhodoferax sp.]
MFERDPRDYVPFAGHLPNAPEIAFTLDGSVFGMLELTGVAFELDEPERRNGRVAIMNNALRQIVDDNVVVYSHLVRHGGVRPSPVADKSGSDFASDLYGEYSRHMLSDLRTNTWFLTVVVQPTVSKAAKWWSGSKRKTARINVTDANVRQLEDAIATIASTLSEHSPRRLGLRTQATDMPGHRLTFTEIGEALFLIRTALPMAIPFTSGSLGGAVYAHRVIVGPRSYDLSIPGQPRFGSIISYRNYPHSARPGCLNTLLSAPYDLVLSQSLAFMLSGKAEAKMARKEQQMENMGDRASSLRAGLAAAMDDLASGKTAKGHHHLSLAVYRPDLVTLDASIGDAMRRLTDFGGANPVQEGRFGAEAAYFAQLPAVAGWRTRPGRLDTMSFAAMTSLEGFPAGNAKGYWGPAIARFRTRAGTAYDFIPHVEDVGHMLITGRSGKGKTLLANFLMACLEPSMGANGIRFIIDKDAGAKLLVEHSGGRYLHLRRGRASGLAPLRGLEDGPETRSFLLQTFRGLVLRDGLGPMDPDEERRMARGIEAQMDMPVSERSLAGVRQFMGYEANGAGDRFEKWCRGGEMGWVLDNDEHLVDFDAPGAARIFGFDFTELMPKEEGMADDGACSAAAAILLHQVRGMMDGRRIVGFFDECRFYLDVLGKVIEDFALTGRKNEMMAWMAAQEPSHFMNHPVGRSIIGQCATKIAFPDSGADIAAYVNGFKFSPAAAEQVKVGMNIGAGRRFLVWRDDGPAILEFDLSAMATEVVILSGRAASVRMSDQTPDGTVEHRYREFRKQIEKVSA